MLTPQQPKQSRLVQREDRHFDSVQLLFRDLAPYVKYSHEQQCRDFAAFHAARTKSKGLIDSLPLSAELALELATDEKQKLYLKEGIDVLRSRKGETHLPEISREVMEKALLNWDQYHQLLSKIAQLDDVVTEGRKLIDAHPALAQCRQEMHDAEQRLVGSVSRLVLREAKKFSFALGQQKNTVGIELIDLVQEGLSGASRAVQLYDPNRGLRFPTYAHFWIRQRMLRAISNGNIVKIPGHVQRISAKLKEIRTKLSNADLPLPSTEDLAQTLSCSPRMVREGLKAPLKTSPVSLDTPLTDLSGSRPLREVLIDPQSKEPADEVDDFTPRVVEIVKKLPNLPETDRKIFLSIHGFDGKEPAGFTEIAKTLNVSGERIRQRYHRVLRKLRTELFSPPTEGEIVAPEPQNPKDATHAGRHLPKELPELLCKAAGVKSIEDFTDQSFKVPTSSGPVRVYKRSVGKTFHWGFQASDRAILEEHFGLPSVPKDDEIALKSQAFSERLFQGKVSAGYIGTQARRAAGIRWVQELPTDFIDLTVRDEKIRFYKRNVDGELNWAIKEADFEKVCRLFELTLKVQGDEIPCTPIGFTEQFATPQESAYKIQAALCRFSGTKSAQEFHGNEVRLPLPSGATITFFRRARGASLVWAFKKADADQVAAAFDIARALQPHEVFCSHHHLGQRFGSKEATRRLIHATVCKAAGVSDPKDFRDSHVCIARGGDRVNFFVRTRHGLHSWAYHENDNDKVARIFNLIQALKKDEIPLTVQYLGKNYGNGKQKADLLHRLITESSNPKKATDGEATHVRVNINGESFTLERRTKKNFLWACQEKDEKRLVRALGLIKRIAPDEKSCVGVEITSTFQAGDTIAKELRLALNHLAGISDVKDAPPEGIRVSDGIHAVTFFPRIRVSWESYAWAYKEREESAFRKLVESVFDGRLQGNPRLATTRKVRPDLLRVVPNNQP